MTTPFRSVRFAPAILLLTFTVACSTKRVHEEPIMENGDRVSVPDGSSADGSAARDARAERDSILGSALADCEPEICEAVVGGEVRPGMTEAQVLAATRTGPGAWQIRRTGPATVLMADQAHAPPGDEVSDVAMVQLREGRVISVAYREPEGLRLVRSDDDLGTAARARARAGLLLREGDDLAARGDLGAALDRYDRADVLAPGDPMVAYRIATVLDKQLRPIQALIQYRLFLHALELERIEARGDAAAKLAEAIAHARERIIVLERRAR